MSTRAEPDPGAVRGLALVRHGATEWSRSGQHTGRTDLELLPEGLEEARSAAKTVASLPIVAAYSSPLRRARDTAALLDLSVPVALRDELVEWDYGEYESLTTPQIRERHPGWEIFRDGCPGGEGPADVAARASAFIGSLEIDPSAAGLALVVAHGHLLRVLTTCFLGVEIGFGRQLVLRSAHLCVLVHEHGARSIESWNLAPGDA